MLLCSDGLTACLGDHELGDCLEAALSPREVCERLIKAALTRGAPDNVSVVSVFVQESAL
jgi:protein phosphatase